MILGNTSSLEESSKNRWSLMYMPRGKSVKPCRYYPPVSPSLCLLQCSIHDGMLNGRMVMGDMSTDGSWDGSRWIGLEVTEWTEQMKG